MIIPSYENLQQDALDVEGAIKIFNQDPSIEHFDIIKLKWSEAILSLQKATLYNFGPAGEDGLRKGLYEEIATFPINIQKTEALIAANNTNFQSFDRDTRGLLVFDYLLYKPDAYNDLKNSDNRRNYLAATSKHLLENITLVLNQWKDNYATSFISDNATSVGSSISDLYNEFIKSYEILKNFKIAIPLGKRAGQTKIEPEKVEAYHSGLSTKLIKAHFEACKNLWYGIDHKGIDDIGFKEYLESVEGGKELISSTEIQLKVIQDLLAKIPNDVRLSDMIINNNADIFLLQLETQKLTRFYKSDLSSLLGIAITFTSGDGD
jgi:predicted lipoprotein